MRPPPTAAHGCLPAAAGYTAASLPTSRGSPSSTLSGTRRARPPAWRWTASRPADAGCLGAGLGWLFAWRSKQASERAVDRAWTASPPRPLAASVHVGPPPLPPAASSSSSRWLALPAAVRSSRPCSQPTHFTLVGRYRVASPSSKWQPGAAQQPRRGIGATACRPRLSRAACS